MHVIFRMWPLWMLAAASTSACATRSTGSRDTGSAGRSANAADGAAGASGTAGRSSVSTRDGGAGVASQSPPDASPTAASPDLAAQLARLLADGQCASQGKILSVSLDGVSFDDLNWKPVDDRLTGRVASASFADSDGGAVGFAVNFRYEGLVPRRQGTRLAFTLEGATRAQQVRPAADIGRMPRVRRRHVTGVVTHVIARFVDGLSVMDAVEGAREQYLERLDRVLPESDWTLCWYCLMGTHVHLGMIAGEDPLQAWIGRVHSGWANWINRGGRRRGLRSRGPIVADRPATILVPDHRARYLGAYIHNNPVRAGVAASAEASSWSSHRAYLGLAQGPTVLDIVRGLRFYDSAPIVEGRQRFHEYVTARAGDPRDDELAGRTAARERNVVRRSEGSALELNTPILTSARAFYPAHVRAHAYRRCGYSGSVEGFLSALAVQTGVDIADLRDPGRERWRCDARRIAVLVWRLGGRPTAELCAALAISSASATNLVRRARTRDHDQALRLSLALRPEPDARPNV